MAARTYTILALGDSYTVGEGVALYESFPYQLIQMLRKAEHNFTAPEILAKTGWTTSDLRKAIREIRLQNSYHYVSLLIGVNDQYQHKDPEEYASNFEILLKHAITFAANNPSNVFVVAIPDWGQTPFASAQDRQQITREINEFNKINRSITSRYRAQYISIPSSDLASPDPSLLVADGLHPSKKEYTKWASLLLDEIQKSLA